LASVTESSLLPGRHQEGRARERFRAIAPRRPASVPRPPRGDESPEAGSPGAQQASLNSIIISRWGIPVLSCDDLAKEIAAAGFSGTRAYRGNLVTSMTARRA
jgi:hypothetical protein